MTNTRDEFWPKLKVHFFLTEILFHKFHFPLKKNLLSFLSSCRMLRASLHLTVRLKALIKRLEAPVSREGKLPRMMS